MDLLRPLTDVFVMWSRLKLISQACHEICFSPKKINSAFSAETYRGQCVSTSVLWDVNQFEPQNVGPGVGNGSIDLQRYDEQWTNTIKHPHMSTKVQHRIRPHWHCAYGALLLFSALVGDPSKPVAWRDLVAGVWDVKSCGKKPSRWSRIFRWTSA